MNKLKSVVVKITDTCNFDCIYCFESADIKKRHRIFIKEKQLLEFLKKFEIDERLDFYFFGGEIFLYSKRIYDIYKEIKKLEKFKDTTIHFAFITNASFPDRVIDLIKEDIFDLDMCKISWDGLLCDQTRMKKGINNDPMFNMIMMNNIRRLALYCKDNVLISMAITKDNILTLYNTMKYLDTLGYKKFEYYFIFNIKELQEYNKELFIGDFYNELRRIIDNYDSFTNVKLHNYELYKGTYDYAFQCRSLGNQIYIDPDGDIWNCALFSEMWQQLKDNENHSRDGNIINADPVTIMNIYSNFKSTMDFNVKEFCQDIVDCQCRHFCNTCPLEIITFKKAWNFCPIKRLRETENTVFRDRS